MASASFLLNLNYLSLQEPGNCLVNVLRNVVLRLPSPGIEKRVWKQKSETSLPKAQGFTLPKTLLLKILNIRKDFFFHCSPLALVLPLASHRHYWLISFSFKVCNEGMAECSGTWNYRRISPFCNEDNPQLPQLPLWWLHSSCVYISNFGMDEGDKIHFSLL